MIYEQDLYFSKFCTSISAGSIIIAQFDPSVKLISPDIFSFFEDVLNIKICSIQMVRDGLMNPTNLVFVQSYSMISQEQMKKIQNVKFKQTRVDCKLFESPDEFKKTIDTLAELKLSQIALPPPFSEGICYIKNFENVDIEAKFSPFGEIKSIDLMDSSSTFPIRAVHFANSSSGFKAAKTLNKKSGMIVGCISVRDSRHNLYIRNLSIPPDDIIEKIKEIGKVDAFVVVPNNSLYVKMINLVDAQIACALISAEGFKVSFVCDETADIFLYPEE